MRTYRVAYTMLIVATVSLGAVAQTASRGYFSAGTETPSRDLRHIERLYARCLHSDNDGVVESALAHTAMLKLMNPSAEFAVALPDVETVANINGSAEIRYKAYLVATLLRTPGLFTQVATTGYSSPDDLFAALAGRMHELIASRMSE